MKQKLLSSILLLFALITGVGSSWATEVTMSYSGSTTNMAAGNNAASVGLSATDWSVTAVQTGAATPLYPGLNTAGQIRLYYHADGSNSITVSSLTEATINNITVTYGTQTKKGVTTHYNGGVVKVGSSTIDDTNDDDDIGQYAINSSSFTIENGNSSNVQVWIVSIVINYTSAGGGSICAIPTFSPGGGTYSSAQNVTISCATDGATIHYTTNGADPTESDATYSAPISITTSGTTIKAKAFKSEYTASSVASATYTIKPTQPTVSAAGPTVTITGDDGCTFYYTTNGTNPTNSSTEYTAPFNLDADCTIKAIAYDAYNNASDVKSYTFKYFPLTPKNINSGYFEKVTDVSDLENGDAILIVNEGDNIAMSTTQNTNNRGVETVAISAGVIYAPSADVQKLVLVKKTEKVDDVDTDVFYFYTGSGYLYAPSSGSNHLKTEETPDGNNNARATIAISSGNATITFKGSSTRNVMQYNSTNSIISCYSSASQTAVQIYREVAHSGSVTLNASGYATFASTYALDFSDDSEYSAWQVTAANSVTGVLTFSQITGKVAPGTGVLLKGTESETISIPVTASGSDISGTNKLVGITAATAVENDTYYGLSGNTFKKVNAGTVPAGKALLPAVNVSADVKSFIFVFEDATAIAKVQDSGFKIQDSEIFNLAGQRMSKLQKGVNIVNGKKVLVK